MDTKSKCLYHQPQIYPLEFNVINEHPMLNYIATIQIFFLALLFIWIDTLGEKKSERFGCYSSG